MGSRLEIVVVRHDGRLAPVGCDQTDVVAVCRQALEVTQAIATRGRTPGDPALPRSVDVLEDGKLILSVAVSPMMRGTGATRH